MPSIDLSPYRLRETVAVAAQPEKVWARVSDLTRMGDASPACTACTWDDAEVGMSQGAWFTGTNKAGEHTYDTRCQIDSLVPGSSFTFSNYGLEGTSVSSRWGYEVVPADGGTELTETWEMHAGFVDYMEANHPDVDIVGVLEDRKQFAQSGITATLAALKAELEQ
jgi:carbon monoxide dehydrogenase subunit G